MSSALQEDMLPEQILQAAYQLYQKHGLKKVTMDDVSKAIGKSRSALYYYYKNRDEIFEAVLDRLIRQVKQEIAIAMDNTTGVAQKIRAFCLAKIRTSEEKKSFFSAIETGLDAEEMSRHAQFMNDVHRRMMQAETELLKPMLQAGAKAGEIRPLKPREQESLIFVLQSGVRGIRRELALEDSFSRLNTAVDTFTAMTVAWLQVPAGQ